ncbi:MAG: carbonic anhydrase [Bacteroidetes bacterium]|uniref:Carbonic anhydrase 2 n=1 Tax=Phaeocystidibacter marisrubri TaxID=1577780 RepID=A0A6L3ZJ59_9FLAO|nr:carbonic anhydrase [Phaeocystidibacter marisrubri]KAB2817964.1 carbonic anhydrase [Phaeocystidibacter marisrubri]TNE28896.1 MAG: carbonic anhydrase [Bacteroidota bacterium]GGH72645.1 carbonic anhydrase [Phaeocystidibacter marisrubri]
MADLIKNLLAGNRKFVEETNAKHPELFKELAEGQSPEFLWIGCADSRVPATEITDTTPGSIFVHRNIANMVVHSDANMLSVVFYAVKVLKVKHIIVCGHYGCGGVKAAMGNDSIGFIDGWLNHIKDVKRLHKNELAKLNEADQFRRFVELNVMEQVQNMARIPFIQESWNEGEYPYIHGWVYDVADGLIRDMDCTVSSGADLDEMFVYNND